MLLSDDKPSIAAHVYALLVLRGAEWSSRRNTRDVSAANVTLERVSEQLDEWYAEIEQRPDVTALESGGIRVVRDRDFGKLDVFVLVGSITFESPPCECKNGELLHVECPVHSLDEHARKNRETVARLQAASARRG